MNQNPGERRVESSLRDQPAAKRRRANSGPERPKRDRPVKPSIIREKIGNETRKLKRRRMESPVVTPTVQPRPQGPSLASGRGKKRGRNASTPSASNSVVPEQNVRPGKRLRNVPVIIPNQPDSRQQQRQPQKRQRSSRNEDPGPSRPREQQRNQAFNQINCFRINNTFKQWFGTFLTVIQHQSCAVDSCGTEQEPGKPCRRSRFSSNIYDAEYSLVRTSS